MNSDDDNEDEAPFDLAAAVTLNRQRLAQRFASAVKTGIRWLVECRDLGDAYDSAAGVYFVECLDDAAVDKVVAHCTEDSYDRLLGIYDLQIPLSNRGGGIARSAWLNRGV